MNPIIEWDLKLGKRIVRMFPNRFLGGIILGERGWGKSMYAYKNMAYTFHHLPSFQYNEKQAFQEALDNIIFTPDQFMDKVDYNIDHDIVDPVWCIDDASVHFHSFLHLMNVYEYILLAGHFDTIRTVCSCLLITCPKKKRLFKPLREYDQYDMLLYEEPGTWERKAVGINWFTIPDGRQKFRKRFEDHFSCYVNDEYFKPYQAKRKFYLKQINKIWRELRNKLKEKKYKRGLRDLLEEENHAIDFTTEEINIIENAPIEPEGI